MTGRDVTTQARAAERSADWEALKTQERRRALPMAEAVERARQKVLARAASGAKPVVPLALQTALAADERVYREPKPQITPPEEKTPERVGRRGRRGASPLGALVKGMIRPGVATKEDSRFAYASGKNYLDRQVPPERD